MNANQELDRLLNRLRQEAPNCALDDVEQRVWQQIAGGRHHVARASMNVSFLLASIAAAFLWGIFTGGTHVTAGSAAAPALLVEEMELLPPDLGGLSL
ncbi:MAG: hypothetical protein ABIP38_04335 [Steroidobacteraceae bacterium]